VTDCRVVVLSSTAFGRRCVSDALAHVPEVHVVGVVTTPPAIEISYSRDPLRIVTHARFEDLAASMGFELVVLPGHAAVESCVAAVARLKPDVILALGWYYMVPRRLRELAPRGCLGIHASLLPKYRGGAPIPWAIINGEQETGVTLFHLDDEVDNGDIVDQERFPIGPEDTCAEVLDRASVASVCLLRRMMPLVAAGTAPRVPQRHSEATVMPQRAARDGLIDWTWSASRVHDFVRAQTRPYPGAFTHAQGSRVTVWRSRVARHAGSGDPGTFRLEGDALVVACGSGAVAVSELGAHESGSCTPAEFAARFGAPSGRFDVQ
jgi:methionyl-tRNA formyltransferase